MKLLKCHDCGIDVESNKYTNNTRKRYCEDCKKTHHINYMRKYYRDNILKIREKEQNTRDFKRKYNPEKYIFQNCKKRANRGIEFNLTQEDIILPPVCPILQTDWEFHSQYAPSVDRIDNDKGYVKGNIQILSRKANTMKNSASIEELRNFARWVRDTYGFPEEAFM